MALQSNRRLAPRVEAYLADVVRACAEHDAAMHSVVLFGSSTTGGYSGGVSDVDLLLVLRDGTGAAERDRTRDMMSELEARHGIGKPLSHEQGALERFADRIMANDRAFFVCTRADLLSGEPGRIFGVPLAQAWFVDRVTIPSIVATAVTVWGEELLNQVPLLPIRRLDVGKALFAHSNQVLFSAGLYPLLPSATKYAMDALKRSVHNCYFCYHGRPAKLSEEVEFFLRRHGRIRALDRLMALRSDYHRSFGFVLSCLPTLLLLHVHTARDNRFPRDARPREGEAP